MNENRAIGFRRKFRVARKPGAGYRRIFCSVFIMGDRHDMVCSARPAFTRRLHCRNNGGAGFRRSGAGRARSRHGAGTASSLGSSRWRSSSTERRRWWLRAGLIGAARAAARHSAASSRLARPPVAVHARRDHRAARPVFLHIMGVADRAPRSGRDSIADRRRAARSRADRPARAAASRRCWAEMSVGAACAARTPGAVCACAPASVSKSPAEAANSATVTIRIITPTRSLRSTATSPIAAPRSTAQTP